MVVDLAVEDHPHAAVLVRQRLLPGAQIDDAQSAMGEGGVRVAVQPRFVRPAMRDDVAHPSGARRRIVIEPVDGDDARNAAHDQAASSLRCRAARRRPALRRAVHELPEPQLQHHQAPEPVAMVLSAVAMLVPEAGDGAVVEDAAIAQPAVEQQRVDHRRQRPAQPRADRRFEAVLRPIDDGFRDAPLEQPAQQVLAPAVLQLQARRHRGGELEQLVIEQRLARLERHGHAHPVDLGHDVVDQVGLHVDVQRAVERILRRARVVGEAEAGERIGVAHFGREVVRVERVARARLEQAIRVLARARVGRRQRQMPERPRALHAERQASGEAPANRPPVAPSQRRAVSSHCSTRWRA